MAITEPQSTYTLGEVQVGAPCCDPVPQLRIRGLSVAYGGQKALEGVTLDIHRGCITALIGPSGCGKTSLLSSLNRMTDLLPGARVDGQILLDGADLLADSCDLTALRRRIGLIFQKPNPFPLSIWRNLALPLKEHGLSKKAQMQEKIQRALTDVGLWEEVKDRLDSPALALSGGQQQRLCIARALVLEPEILLMDEPCSALDPIAAEVVEQLILRLQGRYTLVVVTHNLAQARRIANYAAFFWMRERVGNLIEFGACENIFSQPSHELTAAYVKGQRG